MIETPCRHCVPPVRHIGCLCDAKKQWDEQRRQIKAKIQDAKRADRYEIERIYEASAKKRRL